MALYPIKLLKDKNQVPFFPFNTLESVLVNNTDKNLKDLLDDIYTKEQVNTLINESYGLKFEVVAQLPTTDIDPHTIYLVPKTPETDNSYNEYIYVNNNWELIGSTDIDLSGYQTLIDDNNKLSSDLVDDTNNTHLFVTALEKTTWNGKENATNKVTSIDSNSTDTEYPSAKCVYQIVGNIETLLGGI